jgi:hypothetical protein
LADPSADPLQLVAIQSRFNRKLRALATLGEQTHDAVGRQSHIGERVRIVRFIVVSRARAITHQVASQR